MYGWIIHYWISMVVAVCVFFLIFWFLLKIFYTFKFLLCSSCSDLPTCFFLQVFRGFIFLVITLTHTQAFGSCLYSDLLGFCYCCLGGRVNLCYWIYRGQRWGGNIWDCGIWFSFLFFTSNYFFCLFVLFFDFHVFK